MYINLNFSLKQLIKNSINLGHRINQVERFSTWFIIGIRFSHSIIDLSKTLLIFRLSLSFLKSIIMRFGSCIFINTNINYSYITTKLSSILKMPYFSKNWISGIFSNWKTLKHLNNNKNNSNFHWLNKTLMFPSMVFSLNHGNNFLPIKEALSLKILCAAICDTNSKTESISFPIPGNDDSLISLTFYSSIITKSILLSKFNSILIFKNKKTNILFNSIKKYVS